MSGFRPSRRNFGDVVAAARGLLGCYLVRRLAEGRIRARIVETEAYPHDDPASHSFAGETPRNASMFARAGTAYVYRIHRSICLNVVTGPIGRGEAVLIRALEPVEGVELAHRLRARATVGRSRPGRTRLSNGPGKLCQALAVTPDLDGHDMLGVPRSKNVLSIEPADAPVTIYTSTRIGISHSVNAPLRFSIAGNEFVSR